MDDFGVPLFLETPIHVLRKTSFNIGTSRLACLGREGGLRFAQLGILIGLSKGWIASGWRREKKKQANLDRGY